MSYDENFYKMYEEYLKEPAVRKNHDYIFSFFASLFAPERPWVIDLGCGLGEYFRFDKAHIGYVGVDLNNAGNVKNFLQADYLTLDFQSRLQFVPNAFVSLFSTECCWPVKEKYDFYEKIFACLPALKHGLVGGFFYESKRDQETVSEVGDIVSYQTIENPSEYISENFAEMRIHLRTPSKMFGPDVVEVWKIFARK